jgi:hypothetical protein
MVLRDFRNNIVSKSTVTGVRTIFVSTPAKVSRCIIIAVDPGAFSPPTTTNNCKHTRRISTTTWPSWRDFCSSTARSTVGWRRAQSEWKTKRHLLFYCCVSAPSVYMYNRRTIVILCSVSISTAIRSTNIFIAWERDAVSRSLDTRKWLNICYSIKPPPAYKLLIN